ncbi:MAG: DUF2235 domain-containing protein [Phycisphaerales bacterium]|nr:DUF2235 domain-containing protein [Hyphomonadaceae bacterium]
MKRIIVCMDGTWQSLRQDKPTNVALIARSVAHKETLQDENGVATGYIPQTVIYTQGVGSNIGALTRLTFGSWLLAVINRTFGGALGEGLEDGILDTYLRLSFNYEEGDEIYIFGFSRGAFAARRLAGIINTSGIVSRRSVHKAWEAFELYHDAPGENGTQEQLLEHAAKTLAFRQAHGKGGRNPDGTRYTIDTPPTITYLGVFDTVIQRGIAQVLDSMFLKLGGRYRFKNLRVCPNVLSARHAMAVDESRAGFPATPWDGLEESNAIAQRRAGAVQGYAYYQQRWFIGTHGDIGGGDGSPLAAATLRWVTDGAAKQGLRFYGKHGPDASPMEEEIARAGPDFYKAPIHRPKLLDLILKPQNWFGPPRRIWADRNKRPSADDVVLYLDDAVIRRASDEHVRPRYKPAALRPFKDAVKEAAKRERKAEHANQ